MMPIKIHAIQTGLVRVKSAQPKRKPGGLIRVLADNNWAGWLPIYAWVIDHPEGIIVVDTGDTEQTTSNPDYFPKWHPYYRTSVQMNIKPHEEIGPQLKEMGIGQKDVKKVILTHFHTDHAGGLHHFPESEIYVSGKDYHLAKGFMGRVLGYLPHRWPSWFRPIAIPFNKENIGLFEKSYRITSSGDVIVIPTPGHTPNHISVIVKSEDMQYFLAGDTTYSEDLLIRNIPDGVSPRASKTLETMLKIRDLAKMEPIIYLPTHDEKSENRLIEKTVFTRERSVAVSAA
jgi:glyoxylase-like metal-dependent hydrolase (beta-lactamase superfamily II)